MKTILLTNSSSDIAIKNLAIYFIKKESNTGTLYNLCNYTLLTFACPEIPTGCNNLYESSCKRTFIAESPSLKEMAMQ